MLALDRVRGHVPFSREGWRRHAFWWAVFLAGVVVGIRWAHPSLSILDPLQTPLPDAPEAEFAHLVSHTLTIVAVLILGTLIGWHRLIGPAEAERER